MLTASFFLTLMIISMVIVGTGLLFALVAIVLMYTGRSMSYDRAAKQMVKGTKEPKQKKSSK